MYNNNQTQFCSKCDNQINDNNFKVFQCGHIICNNCLIEHLCENSSKIIFIFKIINCPIILCNDIYIFDGNKFSEFINTVNNQKLKKKYKNFIYFYEYFLKHLFVLWGYTRIFLSLLDLTVKLFNNTLIKIIIF